MTSDSALRPGRPAVRHPYLDHPGPLAFAHRGGSLGGPENSMAAFERAVRLGYRYLETDVHTTADGVLVAFHDDRLDRVTDGTGSIAQLPWRVVSAARLGGREAIPTLEELLDAFPEARFNIDVKAPAAVRPLVDAVRRTKAWDRVCVSSFSEARLAGVRAAAGPRLATSAGPRDVVALKLRSLARGGLPLARGARRRAVCLQVPEFVAGGGDSGPRLVDDAFVRTAHALGLQVHVWTVNDADRMRSLLELGVDGIMTDHIDVLRDVLIERGAWF